MAIDGLRGARCLRPVVCTARKYGQSARAVHPETCFGFRQHLTWLEAAEALSVQWAIQSLKIRIAKTGTQKDIAVVAGNENFLVSRNRTNSALPCQVEPIPQRLEQGLIR